MNVYVPVTRYHDACLHRFHIDWSCRLQMYPQQTITAASFSSENVLLCAFEFYRKETEPLEVLGNRGCWFNRSQQCQPSHKLVEEKKVLLPENCLVLLTQAIVVPPTGEGNFRCVVLSQLDFEGLLHKGRDTTVFIGNIFFCVWNLCLGVEYECGGPGMSFLCVWNLEEMLFGC